MKKAKLKPSQINDVERERFFTNWNEKLLKRLRQIKSAK